MSKRVREGIDIKSPNPAKAKRMGRSRGPLVYNETVKCMVTAKKDAAIKNNRKK